MFRVVLVIGTGVISTVVPKLGVFLNLSGGLTMTFLAFFFPVGKFIINLF